jgi:aryl-alcohol dehydrogenase-like predicted oxidoreductase
VEEIRAGAALADEMGIQLVSSQPQYNMLWRVIEAEVVPACEDLGITQVCWSPLAQGVLSGKYGASSIPAGSRFSADDGGLKTEHKFMQPAVIDRVEKLKPIAADLDVPLATLAVAWVLANPNVSAAIVGASRPGQLDETVKAADLILDDATLELIDSALGDIIERDPAKVESFPQRV